MWQFQCSKEESLSDIWIIWYAIQTRVNSHQFVWMLKNMVFYSHHKWYSIPGGRYYLLQAPYRSLDGWTVHTSQICILTKATIWFCSQRKLSCQILHWFKDENWHSIKLHQNADHLYSVVSPQLMMSLEQAVVGFLYYLSIIHHQLIILSSLTCSQWVVFLPTPASSREISIAQRLIPRCFPATKGHAKCLRVSEVDFRNNAHGKCFREGGTRLKKIGEGG